MTLPRGLRADVRTAARHLLDLGWEYDGIRKNGHLSFRHPSYGRTELSFSPSRRFANAHRSEIARAMGISKRELELRLGLRAEKRKGPKVSRKRNEAGRAARTFTVAREEGQQPERVGTVSERMQEVAEEIRAASQRLNIAVGAEYERLLSSLTRLRQEYVQLEADMEETA